MPPGQGVSARPMPAFDAVPGATTPLRITDAAVPRRLESALEDLRLGFGRWHLPAALAWLDIRNRYRGSVLGPLWLTLSMGIMVAGLGYLYSRLFNLPLAEYLPFLMVSLALWTSMSAVVLDACASLTSAEGIIRQLPLPYSVHALRTVLRNGIVAAHHLPLVVVVLLLLDRAPGWGGLLGFLGLALIGVTAFALALFLGMLCARFRDIGPIVGSLMQLVFFMSPIIWKPELLGEAAVWLPLNPVYALMETLRGPLLGTPVPGLVWFSACLWSVVITGGAFAFFVRYRARVAFWV